ncbi:hypothetical protein [uncultured Dysosmobacter sp.]|uniref:hypothetical protein n=1 Tax=uncultured Dysosmobacter sp. TaxID=2591384 RepID=UPI002615FCFE|nr:hypothetical protein [uncultured Dysosmobacter sp.]
MEKKLKFEALVSGAGKTAKNLFDNAIQAVDQNDDGKFDFSDVSVIAESMGNAVKKGTQTIKDSAGEKARQLELKSLQPIFADSLDHADFLMPKFIRIVNRGKKHAEKEVCHGSIGYTSNQKGLHIVNIFRDSIEAFGLMFYPDCDCEFYYVDPSERDRYIALDEYFSYLKIARINELQKIAQDLGAKHFRVTYKEEQAAFSEKKVKAHAKAVAATADTEHNSTEKKYSTVEIAAEMEFPGHSPIKPWLKYLQRDPSIQTLVSMRLNEKTPLLHQKFMLKLSNSSGMKESDAMKIDAVLKGLKCAGNATVASEAKNESRRYLEYDIEF